MLPGCSPSRATNGQGLAIVGICSPERHGSIQDCRKHAAWWQRDGDRSWLCHRWGCTDDEPSTWDIGHDESVRLRAEHHAQPVWRHVAKSDSAVHVVAHLTTTEDRSVGALEPQQQVDTDKTPEPGYGAKIGSKPFESPPRCLRIFTRYRGREQLGYLVDDDQQRERNGVAALGPVIDSGRKQRLATIAYLSNDTCEKFSGGTGIDSTTLNVPGAGIGAEGHALEIEQLKPPCPTIGGERTDSLFDAH